MLRGLAEQRLGASRQQALATFRSRNCARPRARAASALAAAESAFSAATEDLARARAERRRIDAEATELEQRIALLTRQSGDIAEELAKLEAASGGDANLPALNTELTRLSGLVEALEGELAAAEAAEGRHKRARPSPAPLPRAPSFSVQELHTELATLLKLLKPAEKRRLGADRRRDPHQRRLRAGVGASAWRRSRCRRRRGRTLALAADCRARPTRFFPTAPRR